jgi:ABC-2 type transport system ATP-binding protein
MTTNLYKNGQCLIEVQNVKKSFKDVQAVKGLDLAISAGEFIAILGPNGAGKTTLVEMIEGIQMPDEGKIIISGKEWKNHEKELHKIIGLSLQETRFMDKLTTLETTKLFASFYGLDNNRVKEVIELVGLDEKKKDYVNNLSGGQRQRLALAIALLNKPKILLLDEPTSGLDPNARREIWNILLQLKKENTTLILTTHYMEEAEILCDRIVIMDQGKILAQGSLVEILKQSDKKEVVEFTLHEKINPEDLDNASLSIIWDYQLNIGSIVIDDVQYQLLTLFNFLKTKNLTIDRFDYRRVTLDDIFTSLTGRHLYE